MPQVDSGLTGASPSQITNGGGSVQVLANGSVLINAPAGHFIQNGTVDISHAGWGDVNFAFTSNLVENTAQISTILVARLAKPASTYTGIVEGIDCAAWYYGPGSLTNGTLGMAGIGGSVDIRGVGTVTGGAAFAGVIEGDAAGTITNGYDYYAYNAALINGAAVTNLYGMYIQNITAGTTANYGLVVAGAGNYSIWVQAGAVRLDGTASVGASPSAAALLEIGSGAVFAGAGGFAFGIDNLTTGGSGATSAIIAENVTAKTAAAAFTTASLYGVNVNSPVIGSGSAATVVAGLNIGNQTGGGTNYAIQTGTGQISLGDKITRYNAVATTGLGVPATYAYLRPATQTNTTVTLATFTPSADGSFQVSANINVTVSTTVTMTVTVTYHDEANASRVLTLPFFLLAGTLVQSITTAQGNIAYESPVVTIRAKASTSITIATAGTVTAVTYTGEGSIVQIA